MKKGLCIISIVLLFCMSANAEEHILGLQSNGLRLAVYDDKGYYRYGIINQSGDNLGITYSYIGIFQDDYAIYKSDLYGALNLNGETIIQPIYDYIRYLSNHVFCATNEQGLFLLNNSGKEVAFIQNAIAERCYDDYVVFSIDGMMGLLNLDGQVFLDAIYEEIDVFSCGIIKVYQDGITSYINADGETIFQCSIGMRFSEDVAIVDVDGKTKIINTDGSVLYTSDEGKVFWGEFAYGVCPAIDVESGKYGYIGRDGCWIINPNYDWASDFSDGMATVRIADKYGAIDLSGELIVDCIYDSVCPGEQGLVSVGINDRFGIVNTTNEIISEFKWDDIGIFHNNRCRVEQQGCWGFIDQNGVLTVPCIYHRVENFEEGVSIVTDLKGYRWVIDSLGFVLAPYVF